MLLRRMAEKLSRGMVFRRKLPATFGNTPIYVSPACGLRYLRSNLGSADPTLLRLAEELIKPGDVVWDVGANLGLFAFAASHLATSSGAVYAFEPDVWLVNLLRRSAGEAPNKNAPVTVVPAALSSDLGFATFNISERSRATSSLEGFGSSIAGRTLESQTVVTLTLDWLLGHIPPPQVLKVDVELAEAAVFAGAQRMLKEIRPKMIVEVGARYAVPIGQLLHEQDYAIYDGDQPQESRTELEEAPFTTLAVPR
jgi:FkbM family methyltransferase